MITLHSVYLLAGLLFGLFAVLSAFDRENRKRLRNTVFWGLVAVSFLAGDQLTDFWNGMLVLALAVIAGLGSLGLGKPATTSGPEREARAARHGNWLFAVALIIPATTLALFLGRASIVVGATPLIGAKLASEAAIVALALGIMTSLVVAMAWLRPNPITPFQEGRRLIDSIGWAAVLPQALAALGGVFVATGVGKAVGDLTQGWIPQDNGLIAVAAYTCGMALFTVIMGNAFAAFPIMTAAIGLPLIVVRLHGDPVIMAAIGMLSGFCGTLMTPMAANFNVVPAVLLELPDRNSIFNSVIRTQVPTGIAMLIVNTVLMYALVYRF